MSVLWKGDADPFVGYGVTTVATAPSPATSGTSLVVAAGEGAVKLQAAGRAFIWPSGQLPTGTNSQHVGNTEVVDYTRSGDTLTITRARSGTAAIAVAIGYQLMDIAAYDQWYGANTLDNIQASRVPGTGYAVAYNEATSNGYVGDGEIQIVASPMGIPASVWAYQHTIYQQGDNGRAGNGNSYDDTIRADLDAQQSHLDAPLFGKTQYYGFSFYIPSTNPDASPNTTWTQYPTWNTIFDFHENNAGGINRHIEHSVGIHDIADPTRCIYYTGTISGVDVNYTLLEALQYDVRYDIVIAVTWGDTSLNGHITVWSQVDGGGYTQRQDVGVATMDVGDTPYPKQALYTGLPASGGVTIARTITNTIVHDMMRRGTSFEDVSVSSVSPPVETPTQVFGGSRFYEAPPWRIIVGDLEDNTLTFLDRLAMDRSVTVTRAAARVISGRVPSDNPEVNIPAPLPDSEPFLSEGVRLVSCFRREAPSGSGEHPWVCRARGIVLSLSDDADSDHATSTFTAYDPWKYLYRRPVINPNTGSPLTESSYPAGARASDIIIEQLFLAGVDGGTIFTDYGQTDFYDGTIEATEPLPDEGDGTGITFRPGTTLGEMLDVLVATGTCDVVFDPIYDIANRPGLLCQLSIYRSAGEFRANAVMGWDRWPRSLVQLSRQVEGTERANIVQMFAGQGGPAAPQEQDAASLARFGQYWATQYFPGVPTLAGAHLIAQRQLALLKDGQYTYTLSPASERAPLLFEEYREADTVPVYASERFRDPISGVPVRVEAIPIVIGDDELERVNQMLVSFAPESGS